MLINELYHLNPIVGNFPPDLCIISSFGLHLLNHLSLIEGLINIYPQVWHRRTFQPSRLFAARVDLQGSNPVSQSFAYLDSSPF